ncbi:MAG: hypothetical protein FGF48_10955 [Candidatus Brockarchaeota archaeon]|nr:hypothetical protein [Candidatus Brockarchaeota archaeon]
MSRKKKRLSREAEKSVSEFANKAVLSILEMLDDGKEVPGMCLNCREKPGRLAYGLMVYDNPWAVESRPMHTCSSKCFEELFYTSELSFFRCTDCGRYIRSYNPANPLEEYFAEEDGLKVCLKCIEEPEGSGDAV